MIQLVYVLHPLIRTTQHWRRGPPPPAQYLAELWGMRAGYTRHFSINRR